MENNKKEWKIELEESSKATFEIRERPGPGQRQQPYPEVGHSLTEWAKNVLDTRADTQALGQPEGD